MTQNQKETIIAMRQQQIKYSVISEAVGIPLNTIKTFCRRNGLTAKSIKNENKCKNCGKEINTPTKSRPRLFCCDHCKQTWWNKHRQERMSNKMVLNFCLTCGNPFRDYIGAGRKYCSQTCYRERNINKDEK